MRAILGFEAQGSRQSSSRTGAVLVADFDDLLPDQEFAAKGSFIQYGGVVDHALVVRGITTVYNTDYITDFVFHLNGAIEVRDHPKRKLKAFIPPSFVSAHR
jgi:diamine oxidase